MTVPRRSDIQARIVWLRENVGAGDARTRRTAERTVDDLAGLITDQRAEIDRLAALLHDQEASRAQAASAVAPPVAIPPIGPPVGAPPVLVPPAGPPPGGGTPPGQSPPGGGTPPAGGPPGGTPPGDVPPRPAAVTPLNLAQSFKQVMESVQAQARTAPGDAATIQTLNVEVKGLVQVDASGQTNLVLPQTGAAVDPQTLSTLNISFAAVPSASPGSSAKGAQGQPQQGSGQSASGSSA